MDASARFARLPAPKLLFVDAVHLSEDGHERMAQLLAEPVARLLQSKR